MKKKLLLIIIVIVSLITITGCKKTNSSNTKKNNNKVSNEFKVKDVTFKFNKESTFLEYTYMNAEGLEPDESKLSNYLTYKNNDIYNGNYVFRIMMMKIEESSLEDVEKHYKDKNYERVVINDIEWITYTNKSDTTNVIVYLTEKYGNLYGTNIMKYEDCDLDLNKLAEVFMNGVKLN